MILSTARTDEDSGAHAGDLELGKRKMNVPGRVLTTSELRSAKASKLADAIETPILIIGKLFTPDHLKAATSDEAAWQSFAQSVGRDARLLPGAARLFQPKFLGVEFADADPLRALLDLQHLLAFDVISIPYGETPSADDVLTSFDFARSWSKKRRVDVPLMPVAPAQERREDADALLAALVKRGANVIGVDLQGGFPYHTLRAIEALKERHEDVWIHALQVPPKVRFGGRLPTSQGMVLPYFGVDTFSRWVRPPPPVPVKKEKVNVFDPRGWGVFVRSEYEKEYGDRLGCKCPVCKGKDVDGFYEPDDKAVLDLAKVHDHLAMETELADARKRIGKDGYAAAMGDHKFADSLLSRIAKNEE